MSKPDITIAGLREYSACDDEVIRHEQIMGDNLMLTAETIDKLLANDFQVHWLIRQYRSLPAKQRWALAQKLTEETWIAYVLSCSALAPEQQWALAQKLTGKGPIAHVICYSDLTAGQKKLLKKKLKAAQEETTEGTDHANK